AAVVDAVVVRRRAGDRGVELAQVHRIGRIGAVRNVDDLVAAVVEAGVGQTDCAVCTARDRHAAAVHHGVACRHAGEHRRVGGRDGEIARGRVLRHHDVGALRDVHRRTRCDVHAGAAVRRQVPAFAGHRADGFDGLVRRVQLGTVDRVGARCANAACGDVGDGAFIAHAAYADRAGRTGARKDVVRAGDRGAGSRHYCGGYRTRAQRHIVHVGTGCGVRTQRG